jgi:hypothetical protein
MHTTLLFAAVLMSGACQAKKPEAMYEPVPLEALHQPEEYEIVGLGLVRLGDRLEHPKFGVGEVVHIEAGGPVTIVQLKFADGRLRSLVAEHAALKRVHAP